MMSVQMREKPVGVISKLRHLTREEIAILRPRIAISEYMTGFSRRQWRRMKAIVAYTRDGKLIGFLAIIPINRYWNELGPVYILDEFRGQGWGSRLVDEAELLLVGKGIYVVSHNIAMQKIMEGRPGYRELSSFWQLDLFIVIHIIRTRGEPEVICMLLAKKVLELTAQASDRTWLRQPST